MKHINLHYSPLIWAGMLATLFSESSLPQGYGMYSDPYYEAQTRQWTSQMQGYQSNINQLIRNFEAQYSDELQTAYQRHLQSGGIQMPYSRFVYYYVASGGGLNAQTMIEQQQRNIGAIQEAHEGAQNQFDIYQEHWTQNQERKNRGQENTIGAIQGTSPYHDPSTGQTSQLPYGPQGYNGGVYTDGTGHYVYGPGGQIYKLPLGGIPQPMEERDGGRISDFLGVD